MTVDSLVDMARRACVRHSRSITDIGNVPYALIRPALLKIDNPDQLRQLEQNCPHIIGEDSEIWLNMIKRDIPNWDRKPHQPSNPKNWYKVYRKLKAEAKLEMAAGEDKLKAALSSVNATREQNTAQVVSSNVLPRQSVGRKRQMTYNYMSGRTGSRGASKMSVLDKIKKDVKDASSKRMSRPTDQLNKRSAVVQRAPKNFVEDLKQQQMIRAPLPRAKKIKSNPYASTPPMHGPAGPSYDLMQDRESRLKALKSGRQTSSKPDRADDNSGKNAGLSLEFLEDEEMDEDDELLGELPKQKGGSGPSQIGAQQKTLKRKAPSLFMSSSTPKRRNLEVK